jgi:DNA helicase-2/ATP-dependent DNA helicase PcrA
LIRLLAGPRWAIGLPDLRELAALSRRIARHDAALQPLAPEVVERIRGSAGDDDGSLIDALDFVLRHKADHGWLEGLTPDARERLREAASVFAGLRRAVGMPIPDLVRLIELELRLDVELAANESRGPARIASAQLRAFVDELHAFLAADESGSIANLLAWLDHAEQLDEFAPRTEPPEDDVVQLLTIHGSKGLEWDAVAVVRLVKDELPSMPRDTKGWLGFGICRTRSAGDARWLPALQWERDVAPTQQDLKLAIDTFIAANRARQLDEDRRLAYVAVTRARDASPAHRRELVGHEAAPRAQRVPERDRRRARLSSCPTTIAGTTRTSAIDAYCNGRSTPSGPVARPCSARPRRRCRARAPACGAGARRRSCCSPSATSGIDPRRPPPRRASRRRATRSSSRTTPAPVQRIARPLPERPVPADQARDALSTRGSSSAPERSGTARSLDDALWELDDDGPSTTASAEDAAVLATLQANFAAFRMGWPQSDRGRDRDRLRGRRPRRPSPCDHLQAGRRSSAVRIAAVASRSSTGRPVPLRAPRAEREERMLQLELYRRAYHAKHGVPLEEIDVALYYVADDLVLRG